MEEVDVLMLGHFAKDEIVVDGRREIASGGGVYYGSVVLQRLGLKAAIVTRLHPSDFPRLDELRGEGVQVFAAPAEQTSGIANFYSSQDMERRVCQPIGFAGPIQTQEIPAIQARIYAVVPIIAGEVSSELLKSLARRGPVALDIQGFVRVRRDGDLVFRPWAEMEEGLSSVTYLKVDRAEAEHITGLQDMAEAAMRLAGYGPREVIVTQSSGVTVYADGELHQAPFTPRSLAGRTGRGDTCFASYLGRRLSAPVEEACRLAAIITSQKQEQPGPWRGSLEEVERLLKKDL